MKLLLKVLVFTIIVPGTVAGYIPYVLLPAGFVSRAEGLAVAGALPMGLGAAIYAWCVWDFAVAGRGTPAPIDPPQALVIRGLYRHVRNPMYVGVTLVLLGESALFRSLPLLIYASVVASGFHLFVVLHEEPALRRRFGAAYEEYCQAVPRWIPKA